jgi:hypothetical protein
MVVFIDFVIKRKFISLIVKDFSVRLIELIKRFDGKSRCNLTIWNIVFYLQTIAPRPFRVYFIMIDGVSS